MAKAFVTGGTGFIGRRLVRALAERGDEVTCLVRGSALPQRVAELKQYGAEVVFGELHNLPEIVPGLREVGVVYHLAGATRARNLREFLSVNGRSYNLFTGFARQQTPPTVVLVSSLAAAGPSQHGHVQTESDEPSPISNYGVSKLVAELCARSHADQVPISIIRPPMVLGPGDSASVALFRMLQRMPLHVVPGRQRHRFSLIFADDLVLGLIAAAERGERLPAGSARDFAVWKDDTALQGNPSKLPFREACRNMSANSRGMGVYYLAADRLITYADIGRLVAQAAGRRRILALAVPNSIVWCVATWNELSSRARRRSTFLGWDKCREATTGDWTCSAAKAREQLGFHTNDDFLAQIQETYDWFRDNGWL